MSGIERQTRDNEFVTLAHFDGCPEGSKYLKGPSNTDHKTGFISIDRYDYVRGGSNTDYVPIHRLVAVAKFGVDAVASSVVHHKNGVRFDNRPENLEIYSNKEHSRIENRETCLAERIEQNDRSHVEKALREAGYPHAAEVVSDD